MRTSRDDDDGDDPIPMRDVVDTIAWCAFVAAFVLLIVSLAWH